MIKHQNGNGTIVLSKQVYVAIAGVAATNCFGVKGMAARSMKDGLVHLLRREAMGRGVKISTHEDNSISIYLHIMVDHGINISAVGDSIISQVRYEVERITGTKVRAVHILVDSMLLD